MMIDPMDTLGLPPLTPEERERLRTLSERMIELCMRNGPELFMIEAMGAGADRSKPSPPIGWFALSSGKRRVFMQLDERGNVPHPNEMQRRFDVKEYAEV